MAISFVLLAIPAILMAIPAILMAISLFFFTPMDKHPSTSL
ncbi:hypothetical protein [Lysinibacillus tabacifolii]|nr:hypothetical protein [Lysinibacillus tabacifolii]